MTDSSPEYSHLYDQINNLKTINADLLAACEHAARSEHHPHCDHSHPHRCTCHVGKAQAAIAKARERFAADGLQGAFHHGDFTALPFADASFAMALDRAALTCVGRGVMRRAVSEIRRVLEPGGLFHCNPYSDRHGAAAMGRAADDGLVTDIAAGGLANVGPICFYGREALLAQFPTPAWEIVSLRHMELTEVAPGDEVQAEWRLVARKTGS